MIKSIGDWSVNDTVTAGRARALTTSHVVKRQDDSNQVDEKQREMRGDTQRCELVSQRLLCCNYIYLFGAIVATPLDQTY